MEKLRVLTSKAAPLMLANIDTDVITPMRRLVVSTGPGLAKYAFEPLRYTGGDADTGEPNPDFIMNQPAFQQAKILVTGENFGCGTTRNRRFRVGTFGLPLRDWLKLWWHFLQQLFSEWHFAHCVARRTSRGPRG